MRLTWRPRARRSRATCGRLVRWQGYVRLADLLELGGRGLIARVAIWVEEERCARRGMREPWRSSHTVERSAGRTLFPVRLLDLRIRRVALDAKKVVWCLHELASVGRAPGPP